MTTIYAEGSNEYKPSKFTCMQPAQSQNGSNPSTFRRARLQPLKFSLCGEHARLQSFKFSVCGEFETITILQIFRLRSAQNDYNPSKFPPAACSKRIQSSQNDCNPCFFFASGALKTITHQSFKFSTCGVLKKRCFKIYPTSDSKRF